MALTAAASLREFYPLCLVVPLRGSDTFLAFVPQLGVLLESLTHSIPRSFLLVSLSAYAVGFADALLLCPERALRLFFASVSLVDPVALSPLSRSVSADGFRHWWALALAEGRLPMSWVPSEPLWICGGSTYIALHRTWLVSAISPYAVGAQVGVSYFSCATFRKYSWRPFYQFHCLMRVPDSSFP